MKRFILLSGVVAVLGALTQPRSLGDDKKPAKTLGKIERLDPAFDDLIGREAKLEVLVEGHVWTEGPVWVPRDGGFLLFSDIPRNRVYQWQQGKGELVFLEPSGGTGKDASLLKEPGSNGLLLDPGEDVRQRQRGGPGGREKPRREHVTRHGSSLPTPIVPRTNRLVSSSSESRPRIFHRLLFCCFYSLGLSHFGLMPIRLYLRIILVGRHARLRSGYRRELPSPAESRSTEVPRVE
jgi:hypothetical protein